MIVEHNSIFSLIWNSEKREFTGILTLRNVLELITDICESYDQWQRDSVRKSKQESDNISAHFPFKSFIELYLMKVSHQNDMANAHDTSSDSLQDMFLKNQTKGLLKFEAHDWSIIPKILSQISLKEYRTAIIGTVRFKKTAIDTTLTLESTLLDLLNKMSDQSRILCFLAIANSDQTQLSCCIALKDLLRFTVNNYKGDLSVFRLPSNNITSFANQTLVRANETDSLLHVLRVMAASRISVLPIERKIEESP
jgi:hypothetical protein